MTSSFDTLFDTLGTGEKRAGSALAAILAMGSRAVPDLVERIAAGRGRSDATALLTFLSVEDRVATITPLLDHPDNTVRDAAVRALTRTGDPRALAAIVVDTDRNPDLAISAIGDLGTAAGIAAIRVIVERELGDSNGPPEIAALQARAIEGGDILSLLTVCATATSLAKLGDFSLLVAARALARFANDEIPEASLVRVAAIGALDVMVGPGIASVLEQCCGVSRRQ